VSHVGLSLLVLTLSLLHSFTKEIQNAFLGNDPKVLRSLFAEGSFVQISLPSPIGFSDQVSDQQAYFLFAQIFANYKTSGFYPEGDVLRSLDRRAFIYKARWEFLTSNRTPAAFWILFYVRGRPVAAKGRGFWKITQIRADRIGTGFP
jgi:hypothetical protein